MTNDTITAIATATTSPLRNIVFLSEALSISCSENLSMFSNLAFQIVTCNLSEKNSYRDYITFKQIKQGVLVHISEDFHISIKNLTIGKFYNIILVYNYHSRENISYGIFLPDNERTGKRNGKHYPRNRRRRQR